ncbi:MAG TPA: hypothetical protein HPP94_12885, partial [Desulfuromonadales bacterium]|nr:hypothetical protein [Desulfuromonadales bacterium]
MTEHIVFYGKGGVGTSTIVSNVSAALVEAGFRILQVGCGPQGDSSTTLNGGFGISTVWDQYRRHGTVSFDTVVQRCFKDIYCIELGIAQTGNTLPGTVQALDLLLQHDLIASLSPDFVLYDLSGGHLGVLPYIFERIDVHRVFAATTADFKSLTTVNLILQQLDHFSENHVPVPFGGLIPNRIASSFEESFVSDFAKQLGVHTLGRIPRSLLVRQCELYGKSIIEASPLSSQSYYYRRLANQITDEARVLTVKQQPNPLFRPGKSAHQAVRAARQAVTEGRRWVVDIDLAKFFDRVNHDILMSRVARKIKDRRVLYLIRSYLQAGLFEGGIVTQRVEGTPQGGPLSPLLSNILLDELDKELEKRNHTFSRYADDCAPRTHRRAQVQSCGAARKMRGGPSKPACRSRLQTTVSCI